MCLSIQYTTQAVTPNVDYGFQLIIIAAIKNCNKCTTPMQDIKTEGWEKWRVNGNSTNSTQFFYKTKTALRMFTN
jgi:hypothetical protein